MISFLYLFHHNKFSGNLFHWKIDARDFKTNKKLTTTSLPQEQASYWMQVSGCTKSNILF
jgi:hypothetical protein